MDFGEYFGLYASLAGLADEALGDEEGTWGRACAYFARLLSLESAALLQAAKKIALLQEALGDRSYLNKEMAALKLQMARQRKLAESAVFHLLRTRSRSGGDTLLRLSVINTAIDRDLVGLLVGGSPEPD